MGTNKNILTISNELMELQNNNSITKIEKLLIVTGIVLLAEGLAESIKKDKSRKHYKHFVLAMIERTNDIIGVFTKWE